MAPQRSIATLLLKKKKTLAKIPLKKKFRLRLVDLLIPLTKKKKTPTEMPLKMKSAKKVELKTSPNKVELKKKHPYFVYLAPIGTYWPASRP